MKLAAGNSVMNCVIVDDEPIARQGLSSYIKEIEFLELIFTAQNPIEFDRLVGNKKVDVLFLDIQMPLMTGIEFLRMMSNPPLVILTTAHPSYALEGYELNVIDYLLKPITFNRFFKSVSKARKMNQLMMHGQMNEQQPDKEENFFYVKCDRKYEKIFFDEILFIEAMQNYVQIVTAEKRYTTLLFLKTIEQSLPKDVFYRIHRSYIISVDKVDQIDGGEAVIRSHRIPISRSLRAEAHQRIMGNRFLK